MEQSNDVWAAPDGQLWVSDYKNNRVLRFDNATNIANGAAANGVLGQVDFIHKNPATSQSGMTGPAGLHLDREGRLWVADYNNNRVLRFDGAATKPDGANADGVLGQADFTSSGYACSQGGMHNPVGLAGDLAGEVYVSEASNHRLLVFNGAAGLSAGANASRVLGQTNFTNCSANAGGLSAASLNNPTRAFFDQAAGVLWVADWQNSRVLMYGNPAEPATMVLGQPDFNSRTEFVSQSGMKLPVEVNVDPTTGKIFVSDLLNNRILRFGSLEELENGAAAEAVFGQADFDHGSPNRGPWTSADSLSEPAGLFVDPSGRLWVADKFNNRVLRFDDASNKPSGADADGVLGQPDFDSSSPATSQNGMRSPNNVLLDVYGRLWVTDSQNNRVLRFDNAAAKTNGAGADSLLGQDDFASAGSAIDQSGMHLPTHLFMEGNGRLWVADSFNNRVLRFDDAAAKSYGANADGVLGQVDYIKEDAVCNQSGMSMPVGLSGDLNGRLYVGDTSNNRVLIFEGAAGLGNGANASKVLGQPDFNSCSLNTGGISAASLFQPYGVFFDSASRTLWVADGINNRVLMYGNLVRQARLVLGQPDFNEAYADDTQEKMRTPSGVSVDPKTGKVFVADRNNHRVLRFASLALLSNGAAAEAVLGQVDFTHAAANRGGPVNTNTLYMPTGLSLDADGRLWVADTWNNRVLRFDEAAAKASGAGADGVLGQPSFIISSTHTTQSGMNWPYDVFADSGGRLWVAEYANNRVLRFDNAAEKDNGADANGVLGQADFTTGSPQTSRNRMFFPSSIYVDENGRLWVADTVNNRILRFDNAAIKSLGANADGLLGQVVYSTKRAACSSNGMDYPLGVGGDPSGRLWVSDYSNNRVLLFDHAAALPDGSAAQRVLGQPNFTSCSFNSGGRSASSLSAPWGLFFDRQTSVLWAADAFNNRVLIYGDPQFKNYLALVRK